MDANKRVSLSQGPAAGVESYLFVTSVVQSEILQTVCSMFKAENSILKITDEP